MNEPKRTGDFDYKSIMLLQIFATLLALIIFVYLTISDNMLVAPFFFMSLSLCFFISGFRLYKKNRIVAQKFMFYIVGIVLFIIALQDLFHL
ncbi:hypothetical protein [Bacillus sp. REN16]|uniref:hypothetical protein n=1 Tax=Bacillus sp. REN16 TaxID=2887296 RepID=UPI001E326925|nr:hypothetical protein [Bacillus sp. REN16]MCC3357068.1 hypothetical protein [Bacillus sp. REN16]